MEAPIKYAKSSDVHIAYRIFSGGPHDIVLVPGTISHLEHLWEVPTNKYLIQRLTSFARVIVFDKRGQGLSDRIGEQTLDERVQDLAAVIDAAGSRRPIIYGWSEAGPMSMMFAARHPQRTSALVLYGTYASMKAPPWSVTRDNFEKFCAALEKHWGEGVLLRLNAPSRAKDKALLEWFGRIERESSSPASVLALMRGNYENDARPVLSSIKAPTLVLHRAGDAMTPVAAGRYVAERIAGAEYHELPGNDHLVLDHETQDLIADLIEQFVARYATACEASPIDRPSGAEARPSKQTAERPQNAFLKEGEYWTLSYEGRTVRMRDSKGLTYLARMLAYPHREFHAPALAAECTRNGDESAGAMRPAGEAFNPAIAHDAGEILDARARTEYRRRINELREELEEAKRCENEERGMRIDEEIEALSAQLAAAVGLRGRHRRAGSTAERARVNVTRTIRIAIERIGEHHPVLAHDLEATIRTGTFCSYQPNPGRRVSWTVVL